jgi:ATP-dependent DNA helicase RecG
VKRSNNNITPPTAAEFELALSAWEGQFIEFKESVSDSLAREMVAFANSEGGRIYIGVADDKTVKGVTLNNRLLSKFQDTARNCDPPLALEIIPFKYKGHDLLLLDVPEGEKKPYGCSGGYFLRTGPNSQKMNRDQLLLFLRGVGELRFDEAPCGSFNYPADFSAPAFRDFLKEAKITSKNIAREDLLVNLGLAARRGKKLVLNNAAVLFFAKNPRRFHIHSRITCLLFHGTTKSRILDRRDFDGGLVENVEGAMTFLQRHTSVRYEIVGFTRNEIPAIPEAAMREALLNAVIHRDYFERGGVVMVEMFQDRLQITNPGGLLPGFRVEDLGRFSLPRNPLVADLFLRMGYVERAGSGIVRIREAISQAGLDAPVFESGLFFTVTFPLPQTPGQVPTQLGTDLVTSRTKSVSSRLKLYQVEILTLCETARSLAEIMNRYGVKFGQTNRVRFADEFIKPLTEHNLLSLTIPEKPRSRFQKYVTTEAGKKWLAAGRKKQ